MLSALTLILVCQLAGELIVGALGAPVPGPVLGMVLLFLWLTVRGGVPENLAQTGGGLLRMLSLLFVPAGTGVILHLQLLADALVPIAAALLVSTIATIAVTGLAMHWLLKRRDDG